MSNLEDTIREVLARGELNSLSVHFSATSGKFCASFTPTSVFGISFAEDPDPVKALHLALTTVKLKSKRTFVKDQDLVGTIHQETVDVPPAMADEYLAGIQAKTAARVASEDGLPDPCA